MAPTTHGGPFAAVVNTLRSGPVKHALHDGHGLAHLAYFGAVFFEGHGFYSVMGGVLLAFGIVALVVSGMGGDIE